MAVNTIESHRPQDWRLKTAGTLRREYKTKTLDTSNLDPTVLRILKYWDDESLDPVMKSVICLNTEHSSVAQDLKDMFASEYTVEAAAAESNLDAEVVALFAEVYADGTFIGNSEQRMVQYSQSLTPAAKKRFIVKKKFPKYHKVMTEGVSGLREPLNNKDFIEMVQHGIVQSYMISALATETPLDSPEHKTMLAYNKVFMDLVKLHVELESGSTDFNTILERLAKYTQKIPRNSPLVPKLEDITSEGGKAGEFKMAPLEDVAEDDDE